MSAPADPNSGSVGTAVESLLLQVDRETVLQARAALLAEADRLTDAMRMSSYAPVGECGADPISKPAARGFNNRIEPVVDGAGRYIAELRKAADALGDSARHYGYTEQQITQAFRISR